MAQVAEATGPLPQVADAAQVLPPMYERMTEIESAMPTLVEVQQQLADLPATMDELQSRLGGLSETLERLLASLDTLDANVGLPARGGRADRPHRRPPARPPLGLASTAAGSGGEGPGRVSGYVPNGRSGDR